MDALADYGGAGLERAPLLAAMRCVFELCVTERSRERGLGWFLPPLMESTPRITASGGTLERQPGPDTLFTNEFGGRGSPPPGGVAAGRASPRQSSSRFPRQPRPRATGCAATPRSRRRKVGAAAKRRALH
jgi:hypothetical protein